MAGLVSAAITVIGARFLVAPHRAARDYGIDLASDKDRWLTSVKGVRDMTSGLLVGGALLSRDRSVVRRALATAALIPIGDGVIIASRYGRRRPGLLAMHWGTAACMLAGAALLRSSYLASAQVRPMPRSTLSGTSSFHTPLHLVDEPLADRRRPRRPAPRAPARRGR